MFTCITDISDCPALLPQAACDVDIGGPLGHWGVATAPRLLSMRDPGPLQYQEAPGNPGECPLPHHWPHHASLY